ncbi:MAG: histidinol dehydrogenase [Firmicutes bacterium]|nr:histidinol dehydrogenase [Bacillota bacterium]
MKIRRVNTAHEELDAFLQAARADLERIAELVAVIGREVTTRGNQALFEYSRRFDGAEITEENFKVSAAEKDRAYTLVDEAFLKALRAAIAKIRAFHNRQRKNSWFEPDEQGNLLGQIIRPVERVGIYVPGGTAAYPSSVLMNAIPAQVAGVRELVMATPPNAKGEVNPYTLVAAAELGIDEIYKMGGAQAVFALARGTETIKKVDLITGPGNIYVTVAKKMVYGEVNIDMLAGPSEILVIADGKADPAYLAADLMSQAEHDTMARSMLVTPEEALLDRVEAEIQKQIRDLSRREIIEEALAKNGVFILTADLDEACRVANLIAPEHLELMVEDPFAMLSKVKNAGAIFMGKYTPEPVGDYYAGPNHILPTGGTARFNSPVTVDTFMKTSSLLYYSRAGIRQDADDIIKLAMVEGLTAHANSVRIRKEKANGNEEDRPS